MTPKFTLNWILTPKIRIKDIENMALFGSNRLVPVTMKTGTCASTLFDISLFCVLWNLLRKKISRWTQALKLCVFRKIIFFRLEDEQNFKWGFNFVVERLIKIISGEIWYKISTTNCKIVPIVSFFHDVSFQNCDQTVLFIWFQFNSSHYLSSRTRNYLLTKISLFILFS